jgi:hypothetical protein
MPKKEKVIDHKSWGSRLALWIGVHIAVIAVEVIAWSVLRQLGVEHAVKVLVIGSMALLATACVFAPAGWLRHPAIARSDDSPLLVRLICAGGGGLLWVLAYFGAFPP